MQFPFKRKGAYLNNSKNKAQPLESYRFSKYKSLASDQAYQILPSIFYFTSCQFSCKRSCLWFSKHEERVHME